MENRFRFAKAKTRFDCFDCSEQISITMQFAFDNLRNVRICEPCFYKLSKLITPNTSQGDSSPAKSQIGTVIPVSQENCPQCHTEARQRKLKTETDTVDFWLKILTNMQGITECQASWNECDSIAWDTAERQQLGFAYIQHLANLQSIEIWGHITKIKRKNDGLTKALIADVKRHVVIQE